MNYTEYFEILHSETQIQQQCRILGERISERYQNEPLVAVGILRGCYFFYTELLKHIKSPTIIDFMFVSSYGNEKKSSGIVKIDRDLTTDIQNRHVMLIDDIIDTGFTLSSLVETLLVRKPKSIAVCTMLDKKCCREASVPIDFCAFETGNDFLVGYGLDYRQYYRNMPFIGRLRPGKEPELLEHVKKLQACSNLTEKTHE